MDLLVEQLEEPWDAAAQVDDAWGDAVGLLADGHVGGAGDGEGPEVAALEAVDGAELVAGDEDVAWRDAAGARELLDDGAGGVGLVGEAELDVLDVGGEAQTDAVLACEAGHAVHDVLYAAGDAAGVEPAVDGLE